MNNDLYKDKNWLILQYWGNNMTMKEMGKLSGVTRFMISRWMKKYDILIKNKSQYGKQNWKKQEFKQKMKIIHKKRCSTEEFHKRRSIEQKEMWNDNNYIEKQKRALIKSWKNNTKRKENLKYTIHSPEANKKRAKSIRKHYQNKKNLERLTEQNRRTAKKRSKTMKKRFKNPLERQRISKLTKIRMNKPKVKKKMEKFGKKRRGKTIEELGHKPDCNCTICMQKRGDNSWITNEIRNKKSKTLKKRMKENPQKWVKIYIKAGKSAFESNREKRPYIWKGVRFMSKLDVNCNFYINGKTIDFFPQIGDKQYVGCFVEYHPWDKHGLSSEEYYNKRKKVIDNSEYDSVNLIVIENLDELKEEQ